MSTRWIVVRQTDGGELNPAMRPVKHVTEFEAVNEARRLATAHPGQKFVVFKAVCTLVYEPVRITYHERNLDQEVPF